MVLIMKYKGSNVLILELEYQIGILIKTFETTDRFQISFHFTRLTIVMPLHVLFIYIRTTVGHIYLYREIEEAIQGFSQACSYST
ncbi:hypothetical protein MIMGU_mgv1a024284mg [Erythranthe guttata]|uniref:Uncharacterized protein n=1 Tax=Erythranthe guttata TaxID=4155 RepID=A0A022RWE4_ERYGU|nr:hypothetical protein MIMGU_mgv1a024284mg [Erythranthe guttata]